VNESLPEILDGCRAGKEDAIGELVRRFQPWALGFARALLDDADLAEDAVQEGFVTALARLADLRDDAAFPAWFRQILRTQTNRILRGRRENPQPDLPDEPSPAPSARDLASRHHLAALVRGCLAALPEKPRCVMESFYLDERPVADIAQTLGIPTGTVTRRLHEGRERVRAMLLGRLGAEASLAADTATIRKRKGLLL
jgi:RNA polymerase sigma-70 factor (ECF subfamily)